MSRANHKRIKLSVPECTLILLEHCLQLYDPKRREQGSQVSRILQQSLEAPFNLHPIEDAPNIMESGMCNWYLDKVLFYATNFKIWDAIPTVGEELKRAIQSNIRTIKIE